MLSSERDTGPDTPALPGSDVGTAASKRPWVSDLHERERIRLGFDLHDGPAQTMSAALLLTRMLQDSSEAELRSGLQELREMLTSALAEVYELIDNLGGSIASGSDLASQIKAYASGITERHGIATRLTIDGDLASTSPSLQIAVFRIVQEALSNVTRHARAKSVDIAIQVLATKVVCEISDDGCGFDPADVAGSHRGRKPYGLHSMRERAKLLGGVCTVETGPNRGTLVGVRIPLWHR